MDKLLKTLKSMKKGTRFYFYGKDDVRLIAVAREKRGSHSRDCEIEGKEGVYSFRSYEKFEVVR